MDAEESLRAAGNALRLARDGYTPASAAPRPHALDPHDAADAAELGEAAYILGVHYLEAGNLAAAARWLMTAAQRDVGDAALRLALVLQAVEDPQAAHWFRLAEQAGYAVDDVDQLDAPQLRLSCCPSPADEAVTADALQRAEETVRAACVEAERIVADAREQARAITAQALRQATQVHVSTGARSTGPHPGWANPLALTILTLLATNPDDDHWSTDDICAAFKQPHHGQWQRLLSTMKCTGRGEVWSSLATKLLDDGCVQPLAIRSTCGDGGRDAWVLPGGDTFKMVFQAKSHGDLHPGNVLMNADHANVRLIDCADATVADTSTLHRYLATYPHDVVSVATRVSQIRPTTSTDDGQEQRTDLAEFEMLIGAPAAA
jgi:hypothetical protein